MQGAGVLIEFEFVALVICSLALPSALYWYLLKKLAISRAAVGLFGVFLLILAGADLVLLHMLMNMAKHTVSLADDLIFNSEYSITLYLLPTVSASIGCGLITHVLIRHLEIAERTYEEQGSDSL